MTKSGLIDSSRTCVACAERGVGLAVERGQVRSNVRAFRDACFRVWRCRACASIHAEDEVDLEHYYERYPFFSLPDDWRLRALYDNLIRRLRRAGVGPDQRILDYGCGGGGFVRHLRRRGFSHAFGYDRYSPGFCDAGALQERYDCVVSQDVLEHATEPSSFLDELGGLVTQGGLLAIGTPNAEAIRLDRHVHALHMPYHRHIFSKRALITAGVRRGWQVVRYYRTQYANTLLPFLNSRFYLHYMRSQDDSLDCLMEPPRLRPLLARPASTLYWGLFGFFFAEETDIMLMFRR
jgi:SAM-dependent methyltransferase